MAVFQANDPLADAGIDDPIVLFGGAQGARNPMSPMMGTSEADVPSEQAGVWAWMGS